MEEALDFSKLTLDDVNTAPQTDTVQTAQPAQEPASRPEPVTPSESAKVEAPKQEPISYKWKDDFIKNAVEYYEKTGSLTPYLEAKTIDFQTMSDEEVMRRNLREQYSELSDKAFDRLYKQQVTDKFKLDVDQYDEDDTSLGRELLKTEASKARQKYIDWQNGFKAPEPKAQTDTVDESFVKFQTDVQSNDLTKSILNTGKINIKTGDDQFTFEVPQPQSMLDMTLDNDKFFEQFAQNGSLNYEKWYKTVAYSQNPEVFERSLINYGKAIGRQEVTKDIKNPSPVVGGEPPTEGSGDFVTGLLNAFASRGVHK